MSKLIRFSLPVLVIALTAVVLYLLVALKPEVKKRPPKAETVIQVETVLARVSDYRVQLPSQGIVKAQTESTLAAEVSGTVVSISEQLRKGGRFKQGDWLLTIDPRDYEVNVTLAKAKLGQAQLALDEEKAKAEQALRDWKRLSKSLSHTSQAPDLVLRKPQLAAAEAELASSQAQLAQARLDLERTRILAPFDGVVLSQSVDLGHYVSPGKEIAELSGLALEVILPISARWRSYIDWQSLARDSSIGAAHSVQFSAGEGVNQQTWHGRIVRDSGELDPQSRQLHLIAEIDANTQENPQQNSNWSLLPGDYVEARIQGKVLSDVIVLPRTALIDGAYVWKVVDQRLQKQKLELAWQDQHVVVVSMAEHAAITEHSFKGLDKDRSTAAIAEPRLSVGDEVVSSPLNYAISGTKVSVVSRDGQPSSSSAEARTSSGVTP